MSLTPGERKALTLLAFFLALGGALKAHQVHETRWGKAFMRENPITKPVMKPMDGPPVNPGMPMEDKSREEPSEMKKLWRADNGRATKRGESKPACPIDVNKANAAVLEALPGIGPKTAEAIWRHRQEHGAFKQAEDLLAIKGIGEKKLDRMRGCLILSGEPKQEPAESEGGPSPREIQKP